MRAAVLLVLAHAIRAGCKGAGARAACKGRCACGTAAAYTSLRRMHQTAQTCAESAESGIVERSALDEVTQAASTAVDAIREMRATCAASCARGCRGCRVSRLLNQTKVLQERVDEAAELGYFVDDERTLTQLPDQLHRQAESANAVALDLQGLASHCPTHRGAGGRGGGSRGGGGRGGGKSRGEGRGWRHSGAGAIAGAAAADASTARGK